MKHLWLLKSNTHLMMVQVCSRDMYMVMCVISGAPHIAKTGEDIKTVGAIATTATVNILPLYLHKTFAPILDLARYSYRHR